MEVLREVDTIATLADLTTVSILVLMEVLREVEDVE